MYNSIFKLTLLATFSVCSSPLLANTSMSKDDTKYVRQIAMTADSDDSIFDNVELMASFPGGMNSLSTWLGTHLRYPANAANKQIQGKVIVQFVVEKDGRITNPKILRGVDKELDDEALRIITIMPRWTPGYNNGTPVRSHFILPIMFRLQD